MSRILAISDIHGHAEGARKLLRAAGYAPGRDELYLLGDFIDWDSRTWRALEYVRQLVAEGARAVLGNMERWLLEAGDEERAGAVTAAELEFLRKTPLYIRREPYLFVHAGIRPGVELASQDASDLIGIRKDFWGAEGELPYTVVFGHTPTHKIGAPAGEIWQGPSKLGIDTGAKHGCRLTLADLTNRTAYSCSTGDSGLYRDLRQSSWD
jgi:Predicted phosphoesterase